MVFKYSLGYVVGRLVSAFSTVFQVLDHVLSTGLYKSFKGTLSIPLSLCHSKRSTYSYIHSFFSIYNAVTGIYTTLRLSNNLIVQTLKNCPLAK